jgi:hypothetical protein
MTNDVKTLASTAACLFALGTAAGYARAQSSDPNCSAMDHSECSHSVKCIEHFIVDVAFCCEYKHHEEGGVCKVNAVCTDESTVLGSCLY